MTTVTDLRTGKVYTTGKGARRALAQSDKALRRALYRVRCSKASFRRYVLTGSYRRAGQ